MNELTFTKCHQAHLRLVIPQDGQETTQLAYVHPDMENIFTNDFCLSAWAGNRCVGAAGLIQILPHVAVAWAFISKDAGPHMLQAVRKMRSVLDTCPYERVEMRVTLDYEYGHQLARLLKFEVETPLMKKSGYFKEDETNYVRIK